MIYAIMFLIGLIFILILRHLDEPYRTKDSELGFGIAIGIAIGMFALFVGYGVSGLVPNAQDVVDGKTTFKVTYIDNVPTDSVVVYKDEYKHINWW